MPNDFNIGRDVSLDVTDPVLGPLRFSIRTGWEAEPQFEQMQSKGLDGIPRHDAVPNGHRITFEFDRADPNVDNYFVQREANYFNGLENPLVSITETIQERGGGISIYRYTGVSLNQRASRWRGNAVTQGSIEGMASRKIKVR